MALTYTPFKCSPNKLICTRPLQTSPAYIVQSSFHKLVFKVHNLHCLRHHASIFCAVHNDFIRDHNRRAYSGRFY